MTEPFLWTTMTKKPKGLKNVSDDICKATLPSICQYCCLGRSDSSLFHMLLFERAGSLNADLPNHPDILLTK